MKNYLNFDNFLKNLKHILLIFILFCILLKLKINYKDLIKIMRVTSNLKFIILLVNFQQIILLLINKFKLNFLGKNFNLKLLLFSNFILSQFFKEQFVLLSKLFYHL